MLYLACYTLWNLEFLYPEPSVFSSSSCKTYFFTQFGVWGMGLSSIRDSQRDDVIAFNSYGVGGNVGVSPNVALSREFRVHIYVINDCVLLEWIFRLWRVFQCKVSSATMAAQRCTPKKRILCDYPVGILPGSPNRYDLLCQQGFEY